MNSYGSLTVEEVDTMDASLDVDNTTIKDNTRQYNVSGYGQFVQTEKDKKEDIIQTLITHFLNEPYVE